MKHGPGDGALAQASIIQSPRGAEDNQAPNVVALHPCDHVAAAYLQQIAFAERARPQRGEDRVLAGDGGAHRGAIARVALDDADPLERQRAPIADEGGDGVAAFLRPSDQVGACGSCGAENDHLHDATTVLGVRLTSARPRRRRRSPPAPTPCGPHEGVPIFPPRRRWPARTRPAPSPEAGGWSSPSGSGGRGYSPPTGSRPGSTPAPRPCPRPRGQKPRPGTPAPEPT